MTNGESASDPDPKVTTFDYTARGQKLTETKANQNTVDYTYYLDGLLKTQVEKKANGTIGYDPNGNRVQDVARTMNADDHGAYADRTYEYSYDPRDRIAEVTKTDTSSGATLSTETYLHDAANNVISQTLQGVTTTFGYDRNRLLTATSGGVVAAYNYDPFGRLDTVTAAGTVLERYEYDGFDRIAEHTKTNGSGATETIAYSYDPLDRTTSRTDTDGETTTFAYLGLSSEVLAEEIAGVVQKSYQYSPWGQRLSQVKHHPDGSEEEGFYGYNPHTDVEVLTDQAGDTTATYGYTAYGSDDTAEFTGVDKPNPQEPGAVPYNVYRYNAKRWDPASGNYDMGFRDYSPGLNRFLSRDLYTGALADLNLATSPWTANRYAFAAGNPITGIELDGHRPTCGEYYIDCENTRTSNQADDAGTAYGSDIVYLASGSSGGIGSSGFSWRGGLGVHDRTIEELRDRVCTGGFFGDNCETEYSTGPFSKRRADLVDTEVFAIYEIKPDKYDQVYRGKRQVRQYIEDLGDQWSAGGPFEEFEFDFYGQRIAVRYAGGGVAA